MGKSTHTLRWTTLKSLCVTGACLLLASCSNPQPGPDKSLAGAVLGAGWGAGTGAVIGNQVGNVGPGVAVGAGFGLVQGALSGGGYDLAEGALVEQERELASLKVQNLANARQLDALQGKLDLAIQSDSLGGVYQVFFDTDATSMRSGATANLEVIADAIKRSPRASKVYIVGHADDGGSPDYNERLSESRARSVAAFVAARGISSDQIVVSSFGSKRPIATNTTPEGRQLNRRVDLYIGR